MTKHGKSAARPKGQLRIERAIRTLVSERAPATVCPSEVARALNAADWRPLMGRVREVAGTMAARGEIAITQRGHPVDLKTVRGPIRLRAAMTRQGARS